MVLFCGTKLGPRTREIRTINLEQSDPADLQLADVDFDWGPRAQIDHAMTLGEAILSESLPDALVIRNGDWNEMLYDFVDEVIMQFRSSGFSIWSFQVTQWFAARECACEGE